MNIVITGASRGFGRAIAERFAANGYDLYLSSRNEVGLYKAMEALTTRFPEVSIKAKPFDLSHKAQVKALANWLLGMHIPIDILVNNAGSFEPGSVYNEPEGTMENMMAVNFFSAYHLTRALIPSMMTRQRGHIFNMCSIASFQAYKNGGAYSISKFALYGFSKNLREELKPQGIKVTAVIPGAVLTDSWAGFDNSDGRNMEVNDIARLIYA
ncbi:MAG TPA: SDR family oxidoreductase, partial [Agriterribacter sp.]|nr:SDR family oxidoreductase [Agriterribacter sp.]